MLRPMMRRCPHPKGPQIALATGPYEPRASERPDVLAQANSPAESHPRAAGRARLACAMRDARRDARIRKKRPRPAHREKTPLDGTIVKRGGAGGSQHQETQDRKGVDGRDILAGETQLDLQSSQQRRVKQVDAVGDS